MNQTRTLISKKGAVIETTLTDREAVMGLHNLTSNRFAQDLLGKAVKGLKGDQMFWAHKLVMEAANPTPRETVQVGSLAAVIALFDKAKSSRLKYPKVRLTVGNQPICLSMAGDRSKFPGTINVTDGGPFGDNKWFGRIDREGNFSAGRTSFPELVDFLREFAADPAGVAAKYGRLTGNCCFCGKSLHGEDGRSVAVGYGPVCAHKYGLDWGTTKGWNTAAAAPLQVEPEVSVIRIVDETEYDWDNVAEALYS